MEKGSLAEKAYVITKEKIVYGNISSGEIVTVGDLALQLNMSKTPVRDALNRLKSEGLLKLLPYKGYMVSQVDLKDLEDLLVLRVFLEGGAAELAAIHANSIWIEKLTSLANFEFTHEDLQSQNDFLKINFDFHVMVAEASGNKRLKALVANTLDQLQRVLYFDLKISHPYSMKSEHLELVEVIKRRDPIKAKEVAIKHIENSRSRIFSTSFVNSTGGEVIDFRSI
jgi:DNA-binding GntR family transcriptional regulator